MKLSYKHKLFLCFVALFALFAAGVLLIEQRQERARKTAALRDKLDAYAALACRAQAGQDGGGALPPNALADLLPPNMRLTLIDHSGDVTYDNAVAQIDDMDNHLRRTEIAQAQAHGSGTDIRTSLSNRQPYLYYALMCGGGYVRVALPYDVSVRRILKPDNLFLYWLAALFAAVLLLIGYASERMGRWARQLRSFALDAEGAAMTASKDEIGDIVATIARNYRRLKESQKAVNAQREKLLQHVHSANEGICFFSANREVEFYNGLFIQYLNFIASDSQSSPAVLFADGAFSDVASFLLRRKNEDWYFETKIERQGRTFAVRANIFEDGGCEVIINDITDTQKMRQIKQEITDNITHELRTPVAGIRGCLETILEHPLPPQKEKYFIQRAYNQTIALSEIISDVSLLAKIDEAPHLFHTDAVDIGELLDTLRSDLEIPLRAHDITLTHQGCGGVTLHGSRTLLYAIFRNLTDNVIRYAGSGAEAQVCKYSEDADFCYFMYADTGAGVPDEHLGRLFERFYRIGEGRTRESGGSGLGLAIVKNAVAFHKGSIIAKNRANGGLEFLFTLAKSTGKPAALTPPVPAL